MTKFYKAAKYLPMPGIPPKPLPAPGATETTIKKIISTLHFINIHYCYWNKNHF